MGRKQQPVSSRAKSQNTLHPQSITFLPPSTIHYLQSTITKLQSTLFAIIIFLIPSNLFLNLTKNNAFVQGILVDYLIPKLYLSDIFIGLLFILWFIDLSIRQLHKPHPFTKSDRSTSTAPTHQPSAIGHWLLDIGYYFLPPRAQRSRPYLATLINSPAFLTYTTIFWLMVLLTTSVVSTNPTSSAWTIIKLIEFTLLILWLKGHLELHRLTKPLAFTMIFQSLIAAIQWIQQRSILGYLFLGETSLRINGHLAKTSIGGQVRVLPYGTTAHPNILAGFLTIGILILIISTKLNLKSLRHHWLLVITFALSLLAITLTQSISALIALTIGLILLTLPRLSQRLRTAIGILLPLIPALVIGYWLLVIKPNPLPDSITRRLQLADISTRMFLHHPILGVGPNNFTTLMSNYGEVSGTTRFLQPVHNIFLLFITETGLLTLILTLALAYALLRSFDKRLNLSPTLTIPLLAILIIGLFDHYPLSLQSGRLLLSLAAGLSLSSLNPKNRANFKVTYH